MDTHAMAHESLNIVILGLSITSSWGNGHATCYRGLVRELTRRGHTVHFLERDVPWFAANRDLAEAHGRVDLYSSVDELRDRFTDAVRDADCVIVGSYVPDGAAVGAWVRATARGVTAFYDIDTPVTLAGLEDGTCTYLSPASIPQYDLYLSFSGGPTLTRLETEYGAPRAVAFYCAVDPAFYYPEATPTRWDLGYLGTYSADRQPALERLMLDAARRWSAGRFIVAGPQYPKTTVWPPNVERVAHLSPADHRVFYNAQRFTMNITRREMVRAGHSPSVRLFEAAACGTPIISDTWPGLEELFTPGREILIARSAEDTLRYLQMSQDQRDAIAERARQRVLAEHTAGHRADELAEHIRWARQRATSRVR